MDTIIQLSGPAWASLRDALFSLDGWAVHTLRVAYDGDAVKWKLNSESWSPPYPRTDREATR